MPNEKTLPQTDVSLSMDADRPARDLVGPLEQAVLEECSDIGNDDLVNAIAMVAREVDEQKSVLSRSLEINSRGMDAAAGAIEALERSQYKDRGH